MNTSNFWWVILYIVYILISWWFVLFIYTAGKKAGRKEALALKQLEEDALCPMEKK